MQCAPYEESPIGTVPQAADGKCDDDIDGKNAFPCLAATTATERNKDVIAKPRGERNVPAIPKFADVAREKGIGKIGHQTEAEESCRTDGDVGITRKIAVNLEAEKDKSEQQCRAGHFAVIRKNRVNGEREIVGDNDFFE